jgi:hypothetical protein
VWVVIWSIGFVASIVAFGIAFAAVWLYRKGSGGLVTRAGAWVITIIVIATLLIAFWLGMVVDYAGGPSHLSLLGNPVFWNYFRADFGKILQQNFFGLLLAVAFAVFGIFRTLRNAFATARATEAAAATFGAETIEPQAGPVLNPESTGTIESAPDDAPPSRG